MSAYKCLAALWVGTEREQRAIKLCTNGICFHYNDTTYVSEASSPREEKITCVCVCVCVCVKKNTAPGEAERVEESCPAKEIT